MKTNMDCRTSEHDHRAVHGGLHGWILLHGMEIACEYLALCHRLSQGYDLVDVLTEGPRLCGGAEGLSHYARVSKSCIKGFTDDHAYLRPYSSVL